MEEWLRSIGLGDRIAAFNAQSIEFDQLAELTDDDLRELGLTIGERKRFRRGLADLAGRRPEAPRAERRPMTMMFVDMVGSSRISERLDPEDQMQLLQDYRGFCGGVVERFGGHVARVVGDGILAYFCYPVANENDPERAVRAALLIARDVGGIALPGAAGAAHGQVQVRIGIATGRVIVSDLDSGGRQTDRNSIVGATPNLAARLQSLAPPGGVVIAGETYARIRHLFACTDLGARTLHGFDAAHRAWQVTGDLPPHARTFLQPRPQRLTPFFNRTAEQKVIEDGWAQAKAGCGRAVLLLGEGGIGKSRLVEDFLARALPQGGGVIQLAASAFDQDSALHAASAFLRAASGMAANDPPDVKRGKLKAVLYGDAAERARALRLLARLLDVPAPEGDPYEALMPEQLRERTLAAMTDQICVRAEHRPLCIVFEDLHWLDPTSQELLARLIERAERLPMLVLATAREGFDVPWSALPHASLLRLTKLEGAAVADMVASLFAGHEPPAHVARLIASRTDGVPLFVEEVSRSLIQAQDAGESLPQVGALDEPDSAIPASLHDALMARLDRSGSAKQVAQVAAVVGRQVRRPVLAAVSGLPAAELDRALSALVESGLLVRDDVETDIYMFGHALMRDAAYDTLLRDRKRALHLAVARTLPNLDPDGVEQQPEMLAFHLTEAGEADEAVGYWEAAARRGLSRSALAEATRLLRRGIAALRALDLTDDRRRLLLRLQALLGPALIALHGPAAPETGALYDDAFSVCLELPEDKSHFPIYWGLWLISPDTHVKRRRAAKLLAQARAHDDPSLLLEAHHCAWATSYFAGDFDGCRRQIKAGLSIYDKGDFSHHAHIYANHDAKVCAHGELAQVLWMQGRLRSAAREEELSLAWARRSGHLGSLMHAEDMRLLHRVYRREFELVFHLAQDLARYAAEHGLEDYTGKSLIFRGWTTAMQADAASGLHMLEQGVARERDVSTPEDFPLYACLHAETLAKAGRPGAACEMLQAESARFDQLGLRFWRPELLRVRAEMLLADSPGARAEALALLDEAAEEARAQDVPMLGLRVAMSRLACAGEETDGTGRLGEALGLIAEDDGADEIARARELAQIHAARAPGPVRR